MNRYRVKRYIVEESEVFANSREQAIKNLDENGSYGITTTVTKVTVKKLNERINSERGTSERN